MLRVMRLPLASLRPEFREGFLALPAFLQSMPVNPDAKSLIASYQIEGDHVNFFVNMQGGVAPVPCGANGPMFMPQQSLMRMNFENRRTALLNVPVDPNHPAAAFLHTILQQPQYMVAVDQSTPVLIPFLGSPSVVAPPVPNAGMVAGAAPLSTVGAAGAASAAGVGAGAAAGVGGANAEVAAATASGATGRSLGGVVLWSLLALLLLGGSLFGYYKTLYPWPFVDEQKIAEVERQKANELLDKQLSSLVDKTDLRLDQAYTIAGQQEAQGAINAINLLTSLHAMDQAAAIAAAQQAQKDAEEAAAQAKAEAERLAKEEAERQAKAQAEAERLAKLEAERQAKAQAEAARLAKEEAQKAAAQTKAAKEKELAAAESPATQTTAGTKALPKCETIKKQGKVPVLLLALDGSGSMLERMADGQMRMDSAFKAVNTLIDRIDKNVNIHAYGIQGCPFNKDYGSYSASQRGNLKAKLRTLDPRGGGVVPKSFDMKGIQELFNSVTKNSLTPLIGALQALSAAAPANSDATAIVISDGLDSCYKGGMTICDVARQIHAKKPKLKIHVVYMGDARDLNKVDCVAKLTNGQIFNPNNTSQLVNNIEKASQTLVKVCQ